MTEERWLVSIMLGMGESAQFLMTDAMSKDEAERLAAELVKDCENGYWLHINETYANCAHVTTVRPVRARAYGRGRRE